jgi:hypothetical protein
MSVERYNWRRASAGRYSVLTAAGLVIGADALGWGPDNRLGDLAVGAPRETRDRCRTRRRQRPVGSSAQAPGIITTRVASPRLPLSRPARPRPRSPRLRMRVRGGPPTGANPPSRRNQLRRGVCSSTEAGATSGSRQRRQGPPSRAAACQVTRDLCIDDIAAMPPLDRVAGGAGVTLVRCAVPASPRRCPTRAHRRPRCSRR